MNKRQKKTYSKPVFTFQDINFGIYGCYAVDTDTDDIRDIVPVFPLTKKDPTCLNRG